MKVVTLLILFDLIAINFASIEQHHVTDINGNLQQDIIDFLDLIPFDDIRNLTKYFYANDESMRNAYEYLRSDGYKFAIHRLKEVPMLRMFTTKLNETGVKLADMEERIKEIVLTDEEAKSIVGKSTMFNWFTFNVWTDLIRKENCVNHDKVKLLAQKVMKHGKLSLFIFSILKLVHDESSDLGGMSAFMKEAITMIPQDEVLMLFFRKLEESIAFSSFLEKLNEEDFEKMCENFQVSMI